MLNTSPPPKTIQTEKKPKKISLTIFTICLLSSQHVFIEANNLSRETFEGKRAFGLHKASSDPNDGFNEEGLLGDNTYHDLLIPTDKAYLGSIEPIRTFPSNTSIAV